jgi:hypothetical protein
MYAKPRLLAISVLFSFEFSGRPEAAAFAADSDRAHNFPLPYLKRNRFRFSCGHCSTSYPNNFFRPAVIKIGPSRTRTVRELKDQNAKKF